MSVFGPKMHFLLCRSENLLLGLIAEVVLKKMIPNIGGLTIFKSVSQGKKQSHAKTAQKGLDSQGLKGSLPNKTNTP